MNQLKMIHKEIYHRYLFIAYGTSSRICQKALELGRNKGIKVGLFRPITLFPYPSQQLKEMSKHLKGILSVEMNAGQMIEDVILSVGTSFNAAHFGRMGGVIPTPNEVLEALEQKIIGG